MRISDWSSDVCSSDLFGPSINQRIRNHTHMAKKAKKAVKKAAPKKAAAKPAAPKPIKEALSKSGLVAHIANATGVAAKDVRAVMASLEGAVQGSVSKKGRSEEHTSELQSLMRISYAVFCLKKNKKGTQAYSNMR